MLKRIRAHRDAMAIVKPSMESSETYQRETDVEFDSMIEEVVYSIKEFGFEEQQGYALADSLYALALEMFDNGKVSREIAMSLESISPDLIDPRYPTNSYTLLPSRTNLSVAMESALTGRNALIGGIVIGVLLLLVKIFGKLGETGGSVASSGTAIAASAKPLSEAAQATVEAVKNPTVAERLNELMKEDPYINKIEKFKKYFTRAVYVLAYNKQDDKYYKALHLAMLIIPTGKHRGGSSIATMQASILKAFEATVKLTQELNDNSGDILGGLNSANRFKTILSDAGAETPDKIVSEIINFCKLGGVEISGEVSWASFVGPMMDDIDKGIINSPDLSHPIMKLSQYVKEAVKNLRDEYSQPSELAEQVYARHHKPLDAFKDYIGEIERLANFVSADVPDTDFQKKSEEMSMYFKKMADNWQNVSADQQKLKQDLVKKQTSPLSKGDASSQLLTRGGREDTSILAQRDNAGYWKASEAEQDINNLTQAGKMLTNDPGMLAKLKIFEDSSKNIVVMLRNLSNELAICQLQMLKLFYATNSDVSYLFSAFSTIVKYINTNARRIDKMAIEGLVIGDMDDKIKMSEGYIKNYEDERPNHIVPAE